MRVSTLRVSTSESRTRERVYVLPPMRGFQPSPRDLVQRLAVVCMWPSYSCSLFTVQCPMSSVQCPVSSVLCPVCTGHWTLSSALCPVSSRDHCPWFTSVHYPALTGGPCPVSSVQPSMDCPCTLLCWWPSHVHCFSMGGSALSSRHPNTVCSVQCAVYSVQCAVCCVLCAVCCV